MKQVALNGVGRLIHRASICDTDIGLFCSSGIKAFLNMFPFRLEIRSRGMPAFGLSRPGFATFTSP